MRDIYRYALVGTALAIVVGAMVYLYQGEKLNEAKADIEFRQGRITRLTEEASILRSANDSLSGTIRERDQRIEGLLDKLRKLPPVPPKPDPVYLPDANTLAYTLRDSGLGSAVPLAVPGPAEVGISIKDGNTVYRWKLDNDRIPALEVHLEAERNLHIEAMAQIGTLKEKNNKCETLVVYLDKQIAERDGQIKDYKIVISNEKSRSRMQKIVWAAVGIGVGFIAGRR